MQQDGVLECRCSRLSYNMGKKDGCAAAVGFRMRARVLYNVPPTKLTRILARLPFKWYRKKSNRDWLVY